MRPRVYVIPASPPCACIEAVLQRKGVAYDVTELPNVLHVPFQLARFRRSTVPAMTLGDERIVGSRQITRRIDGAWPTPPMYGLPAVEEAEAWAEDALQPIARRLIWWAISHCHAAMPSYLEGARLPMPPIVARAAAPLFAPLGALRNAARDEAARADVAALPALLAHVAALVDEGVIGGAEPNAADLQIASNLRLLLTIEDVAGVIETSEPAAAELARRWFPSYPGHVPAGVVPAAWLP